MTKSQRARARFAPRDMVAYLNQREQPGQASAMNRRQFSRMETYKVLVYTSKATLDTVAGSPIYPGSACKLMTISLNVAGNPSSTLTCDLLVNGNSVFQSGDTMPTIPSGQKY